MQLPLRSEALCLPVMCLLLQKYCWSFGANLASIHEWDEYDFVINLMNEMGYNGPAWIGAFDAVRVI